jgi:hypothetical protein
MRHHDMRGSAFGPGGGVGGRIRSEGPQLMQDRTNDLPRICLPRA